MQNRPSLQARHQLALSPRLYQSLKILRLSANDLLQTIQRELDENPALDIPEPADFDLGPARPEPGEPSVEVDLWRDLAAAERDEAAPERRDPFRPAALTSAGELTAAPVTLEEHLTLQLNLKRRPDHVRRDALAIIGSLDGDGYLRETTEEIAHTVNRPVAEVEQALEIVQGFDPPGVAARNLEECLLIQLRQLGSGKTAMEIAGRFLPLVAKGDFSGIAKALALPRERVERAVALIRGLNPFPGALFDTEVPAAAVIPDVYVTMDRGRARVLANREMLPPLHINELYRQIVASAGKEKMKAARETAGQKKAAGKTASEPKTMGQGAADPATVSYIREKIRSASRLIRDVDQRRTTVTRVARAIADSQPDFFARGPEALHPLSLEQIAERLQVNPSTISRAILGKYMSTPYGVFEFRYFFSGGYTGKGGEALAATAVKDRLKKIVTAEDERRPLSDQKITDMMRGEGIPISRRTVAKYREEMGIPPSSARRQRA
jgi:RNA polymerase sigma-54 factor